MIPKRKTSLNRDMMASRRMMDAEGEQHRRERRTIFATVLEKRPSWGIDQPAHRLPKHSDDQPTQEPKLSKDPRQSFWGDAASVPATHSNSCDMIYARRNRWSKRGTQQGKCHLLRKAVGRGCCNSALLRMILQIKQRHVGYTAEDLTALIIADNETTLQKGALIWSEANFLNVATPISFVSSISVIVQHIQISNSSAVLDLRRVFGAASSRHFRTTAF